MEEVPDCGIEQNQSYNFLNDKRYEFAPQDAKFVSVLQCKYMYKEDGRLLLYASHAPGEGYQSIVICSEDTDVSRTALAFQNTIGVHLFQKYRNRT